MQEDIETFVDNSPFLGINLLPDRFGKETIIEKQQKDISLEIPVKRDRAPRF